MALPLLVANEFIRVNHAGYAASFCGRCAGVRFIGPHNAAAALDDYILFAPGDFGRKSNFKLHRRADFERSIGADVDAGGAEVAGDSAGFRGGILLMDLDRQMQWKSFTGTRFSHDASSARASKVGKKAVKPETPRSEPE